MRLRVRPAADARGGAADLRRARRRGAARAGGGRWPAASAPASAAWCGPTPATGGCASTARSCGPPSWRRTGIERGRVRAGLRRRLAARVDLRTDLAGLELAHPVLNGSGTFDAIAALRTFGDALRERFPFSAFVSKTITLAPRGGNPPAAPVGERPPGLINSIGLPNKGLEGLSRARPARAGDAAGAPDRERGRASRTTSSRRWSRRSPSAARSRRWS